MTVYEIVKSIHIAAVVVGLGATFAYPLMFAVAANVDARSVPTVHEIATRLDRWLVTPGLAIVLLSGLYLTVDAWDFGQPWISATLTIILALFALAGAFFIPQDRKLAEVSRRDVESAGGGDVTWSDEYQRLVRRMNAVGTLAGLLVLAAIFLMVAKPGS